MSIIIKIFCLIFILNEAFANESDDCDRNDPLCLNAIALKNADKIGRPLNKKMKADPCISKVVGETVYPPYTVCSHKMHNWKELVVTKNKEACLSFCKNDSQKITPVGLELLSDGHTQGGATCKTYNAGQLMKKGFLCLLVVDGDENYSIVKDTAFCKSYCPQSLGEEKRDGKEIASPPVSKTVVSPPSSGEGTPK